MLGLNFPRQKMVINPDLPVEIVRTNRRKTIAIKVMDGTVRVLAPKRVSVRRLQHVVQQKMPWILGKLRLQSESPVVEPKAYVTGENFVYLGKRYRLEVSAPTGQGAALHHGCFWVEDSLPVSVQLHEWYQRNAEKQLSARTAHYARLMGVVPRSVVVKQYKSRWGSCSVMGDIAYNWQIIIAPSAVVDYVVVHELCHLRQHNHSPRFWQAVADILPNYRDNRQWLKTHGHTLVV